MNNNIIFSFQETDINNDICNDETINQLMNEFEEEDEKDVDFLNLNLLNMNQQINNFSELTEYKEYTEYDNYTIKDLLKICDYYNIENNVKIAKCKKHDIISTIQYYESLPENIHMVQKRKAMWFYITELLNDPKMKKYIILF